MHSKISSYEICSGGIFVSKWPSFKHPATLEVVGLGQVPACNDCSCCFSIKKSIDERYGQNHTNTYFQALIIRASTGRALPHLRGHSSKDR